MAEEEEYFQIEPHAMERFHERWQILHGKPLEESDVLPRLHRLIEAAKPEPENDDLAKRNQKYGGRNRYLTNGPWRFVWQGNRLVTIELRSGRFSSPRLYKGEVLARMCLRITEDFDQTVIEKSDTADFSRAVSFNLSKMPEINAIIRFLRLSGSEVRYKRTGTEAHKQAVLEVFLPKDIRQFKQEKSDGRMVWLVFQGYERPYIISGIAPDDYEEILGFVTNQEWFEDVKRVRKEREKEIIRKRAEKRTAKRRERRQRRKEEKAEEPPPPPKRPISEILAASDDAVIVWQELLKNYRERIYRQECKLGKTWVLHYRFLNPHIAIFSVIRDASLLDEERRLAIEQLVSQLREKEGGTR